MRLLRRYAGFALLLTPSAAVMRADATFRYHTDIQTAPIIPAGVLDQALAGRSASANSNADLQSYRGAADATVIDNGGGGYI